MTEIARPAERLTFTPTKETIKNPVTKGLGHLKDFYIQRHFAIEKVVTKTRSLFQQWTLNLDHLDDIDDFQAIMNLYWDLLPASGELSLPHPFHESPMTTIQLKYQPTHCKLWEPHGLHRFRFSCENDCKKFTSSIEFKYGVTDEYKGSSKPWELELEQLSNMNQILGVIADQTQNYQIKHFRDRPRDHSVVINFERNQSI